MPFAGCPLPGAGPPPGSAHPELRRQHLPFGTWMWQFSNSTGQSVQGGTLPGFLRSRDLQGHLQPSLPAMSERLDTTGQYLYGEKTEFESTDVKS